MSRAKLRTVPELRARVAQASAVFRQHRTTGVCVAPLDDGTECGKPTIRSHLVAQSSQLDTIAVAGHVMAPKSDLFQQWLEDDPPVGRLGVGKASTFPGFCSDHDTALFRKVDEADFPVDKEASFHLAYRAIAREVVARRCELSAKQDAMGMPPPGQMLARLDDVPLSSVRMELLGWRNMEATKLAMDQALLNGDFRRLRWAAWATDRPPEVVASSHVCPDADFGMSTMQDVMSERPAFFVAASILSHSRAGLLHLSWFEMPDPPNHWMRLVRSLTEAGRGANDFLIWMLLLSESVYWSENWWNALPDTTQEAVRKMLNLPGIYQEVQLVDWQIRESFGAAKAASRRWPSTRRRPKKRR